MVTKSYIPDRGDLVWIDFDPVLGHEQGGRRPALVVSPEKYNKLSRLALVCPLTKKVKNYPFEVWVEAGKFSGVILADHLKSTDWKTRKAEFINKVDMSVIDEVRSKIETMIF
ncbi:MAG: endoribonuclease MazF [Candidatus Sungbacteria bacterium]|uniref:Endoribonuclease MazF n=1 Tax=Candidatus Sungiibacteriota bacterium TaxID=2750080 RepID=A0A9D6HQM0_9BACT|nr:endoribonuclease MazF [Candidatus Sungbacteria bacterium]